MRFGDVDDAGRQFWYCPLLIIWMEQCLWRLSSEVARPTLLLSRWRWRATAMLLALRSSCNCRPAPMAAVVVDGGGCCQQ